MDEKESESSQSSASEAAGDVTPPDDSSRSGAPLSDRLEHVIDDTHGRDEAVELTINQLLAGTSFEKAAEDLIAAGWSPESADGIVEEAREATRRQRGVRTREDVVIGVSRKFGKTIRRVRWLIIIGIVIVSFAIWMMLNGGE